MSKEKIIVMYGARQCGKTTLAKHIAKQSGLEYTYYNCDENTTRNGLEAENAKALWAFLGKAPLIILDEAQRVKNIGLKLKILHDNDPSIKIIATGSSSFDLANDINEPLTGRMISFIIPPISYQECRGPHQILLDERELQERLLYGSYPEIFHYESNEDKRKYLMTLSSSYITKDIFALQDIKKSDKVFELLQLLAYQIGSEVNYQELSNRLNIHIDTVQRYIGLLEQGFIIYRLPSFQNNKRNEIGKSRKIYFWDVGVRNALINDFNNISIRRDRGALWENRIITERKKHVMLHDLYYQSFFWRTYQQQEVDYVETSNGAIHAYEIKWSEKKAKISKPFGKAYPEAQQYVIHTSNYYEYIARY